MITCVRIRLSRILLVLAVTALSFSTANAVQLEAVYKDEANGVVGTLEGYYTKFGGGYGVFQPETTSAFKLLNTNAGAATFSASSNASWLVPSITGGTLSAAGDFVIINANLDEAAANALGSGVFTGTITITAPGSTTIHVLIGLVKNLAVFTVHPLAVTNITGSPGGPFTPSAISYKVINLSNVDMVPGDFLMSTNRPWFTAPSTFAIPAGGFGTATFTINTDANTLPPGTEIAAAQFANFPSNIGNFDVNGSVRNWRLVSLTATTVVAAVLPYARSVQIGQQASAFGVMINAGTTPATGCSVALPPGPPGSFIYQTTNVSNQLTGSPNTPANIAPGAVQNFVFGYTPSAALDSLEIGMVLDCDNTAAAGKIPGVNTIIMSATPTPTPDIIAIGATVSNDGITNIPGNTGTGFFAAAGVNIGATQTITAIPDDGNRKLPVTLSICQTDPNSGACLSPPAPSTTTTFNSNATLTFTVFAQGAANIPYDPANNRLFLRFKDATGVTRGATNVAVRTAP